MPIPHRVLLVLLALLGSVVLWGCDTGPAPTQPPVPTAGGAPAAPTAPPAIGGSAVAQVGNWRFSAASLKVYEFLPDPAGGAVLTPTLGTFTTVLVMVTNNGPDAAHLALTDFQLTDSAGHTFIPDAKANTYYSGSKTSSLSPVEAPIAAGASQRMGVVFDIPPGASGLNIVFLGKAKLYLGRASQ